MAPESGVPPIRTQDITGEETPTTTGQVSGEDINLRTILERSKKPARDWVGEIFKNITSFGHGKENKDRIAILEHRLTIRVNLDTTMDKMQAHAVGDTLAALVAVALDIDEKVKKQGTQLSDAEKANHVLTIENSLNQLATTINTFK